MGLDFLKIQTRASKRGTVEVFPSFIIRKSNDLMIRGKDFYAIWDAENQRWSKDESDVVRLVDQELDKYVAENEGKIDDKIKVMYMWNSSTRSIESWHRYVQRDMRDNWHGLDESIIFQNTEPDKKNYSSHCLPYSIKKGKISGWNNLLNVLYEPEEKRKIEWSIGSIFTGDSKKNQKFLVFYGSSGTGKSTVLNIIQDLFEGYYETFDAKTLGNANSAFALEQFRNNPLVAIQHDGDLSRIEDNTRLNSLVSHELMTVNEKFKSSYTNRFHSFLFMGTNKPVKITDAKSGIIRRLIDVKPTGDLVKPSEYKKLMKEISFELGAIAQHCIDVYQKNPGLYDNYIPVEMMSASNDFYNFMEDSYFVLKEKCNISLKSAWEMYKQYCDDAKVLYPMSRRPFQEEMKNYFEEFHDRYTLEDGTRCRSYYVGFKKDIFDNPYTKNYIAVEEEKPTLYLSAYKSILDTELADQPAQYANEEEKPKYKWENVRTKLSDIDTKQLHYVKVPENHIVIDFDLKDENGEKSLEKNLEAAAMWPETYAELSKSGKGVHLHYIYLGDVRKLSPVISDHIECKVFTGGSSLRRRLTKCNKEPVRTINSGIPLKEEKPMLNVKEIKTEKGLRNLIERNLNKEIHGYTKPSVDFIYKILDDAYKRGMKYDVSDMRPRIISFAASSKNQSDYCIKLVSEMKFKSDDGFDEVFESEKPIVFYDVEVFPNLFLINWKVRGQPNNLIMRMINPTPEEVEQLMQYRLVGFNCRRYDNHMLYGRLIGETNEQLYQRSYNIVNKNNNAMFGEAYNISYTDIYDFAAKKQSLKKWEIEMGIHHQELGLPWDQPVPEELWPKVAEYCDNDVIATEALFEHLQGDWTARKILAALAGGTVNMTTNALTTKIIFGPNRNPQDAFNYRFLGDCSEATSISQFTINGKTYDCDPEYTWFTPDDKPCFPNYIFDNGKSIYRGVEIGEGGNVYAEPGMYGNIALLDVASMHPSSIEDEVLFGPYTENFSQIKQARIYIKHKDFEKAKSMLDGKLAPYLEDESTAKDLAQALKIAINSVYGLTAAHFDNPFRDLRNVDNIVAKRGALFMENLKHEVQARGFIVAHIKTDSIKIPDATPEIIEFVQAYGQLYGYTFEHEATYDRMCLVNDAVYIAKYDDGHWSATGTQFQVPYVFKTLFSHEEIQFEDMCETKSVAKGDIYLDMNEGLVEGKHGYVFVGHVGQFSPILPGKGGGILYRVNDGKYYALPGTKGYRWLESEYVRQNCLEENIDESFYSEMTKAAVETILAYGDFDWFVSDRPYISPEYVDGHPDYQGWPFDM